MSISLGDIIPEFDFVATNIKQGNSKNWSQSLVVLYFYPRDNTSGCTQEGLDFSSLYPDFQSLNCKIFGISRDSLKTHENFKSKKQFPFELISDQDENICNIFNVIQDKNMYGKVVRGIERSTFILQNNKIISAQRKIKVPNHAQQTLANLQALLK